MIRIVGALVAISLLGCGLEQPEANYGSFESAKSSGAIEAGWIPEWLPESSKNIMEAHDVDTNEQHLSFKFAPNELWVPPPSCGPIQPFSAPMPRLQKPWWPSDTLRGKNELGTGLSFFKCHNLYLAIHIEQGYGFIWRTAS